MSKAVITLTKKTNLGNYENIDVTIQLVVDDASDDAIGIEFDRLRKLVDNETMKSVEFFNDDQEESSEDEDENGDLKL